MCLCVCEDKIRFDVLFSDPWLRIVFFYLQELVWFGLAMSGQDILFFFFLLSFDFLCDEFGRSF